VCCADHCSFFNNKNRKKSQNQIINPFFSKRLKKDLFYQNKLLKKMAKISFVILFIMTIFAFQPANVNAGPIAYAVCQSACNLGWVSCYASAGLVAGIFSII
jgi:hypothetical protein